MQAISVTSVWARILGKDGDASHHLRTHRRTPPTSARRHRASPHQGICDALGASAARPSRPPVGRGPGKASKTDEMYRRRPDRMAGRLSALATQSGRKSATLRSHHICLNPPMNNTHAATSLPAGLCTATCPVLFISLCLVLRKKHDLMGGLDTG